ncbi:MAG: hypothetical protein M1826_003710 [Phylliscum demangeonii]|nr:MAG: hypothetical protein M1826_003710 [Phylliscum demangeonii]
MEFAPGPQVLDLPTLPQNLETPSTMINQDGLEWDGYPQPRWVREPSTKVIESLARKHLSIPPADRCLVVVHDDGEGFFHKLFRVIPGGGGSADSGYFMRVALPVDPHHQTASEVATMDYVRSFTTIPVPKVVAYDSSNRNALGFEWILMEAGPGTALEECWEQLPMAAKEQLVRQLADYQAQLFANQQHQIGNVYYTAPSSPAPSQFSLGRIVQDQFFCCDHIHLPVPRGPFRDCYGWLSPRLALIRHDRQRSLESADADDEDRKMDLSILALVPKLLKVLPSVFPPDQPESTFLCHDLLSMDNILVDKHGVVTAVLGWDCVSTLPLWRACKMPYLFRRQPRHEEPLKADYLDGGDDEDDGNPAADSLYWDHQRDFEVMQLRSTYLDEMQRRCPEWVKIMPQSVLQKDFERAVAEDAALDEPGGPEFTPSRAGSGSPGGGGPNQKRNKRGRFSKAPRADLMHAQRVVAKAAAATATPTAGAAQTRMEKMLGAARKPMELAHGPQNLDLATPAQNPETPSTTINQDGLEWESSAQPRWAREPSTEVIESLARKHLSIPPADRCHVVAHRDGERFFHKLFRVIPGGGGSADSGYFMRVALPVDPHYQTASEVATMAYIRSFTTIPVPKVVAYDSSNRNALGFEWILMEAGPGTALEECWEQLPMAAKERLVRQLAGYQVQLFSKQHHQIGNLYCAAPLSPAPSQFSLGRIVQDQFFCGDHVHLPVPRGPFQNCHGWLSPRLALIRHDRQRSLESADADDDDREDDLSILDLVQRLLKVLPSVFPPDQPESTFLCHDRFSMENIFVDDHGVVSAVLGWGCVSTLPLWRTCKMPNLFRRQPRLYPPVQAEYAHDGDDDEDGNPTVNEFYWEHQRDFEVMRLRSTYLDEMQSLCPEWIQEMHQSQLQKDFENAVKLLDLEIGTARTHQWLDDFEDGKPTWSLATGRVDPY